MNGWILKNDPKRTFIIMRSISRITKIIKKSINESLEIIASKKTLQRSKETPNGAIRQAGDIIIRALVNKNPLLPVFPLRALQILLRVLFVLMTVF
jgi:hypothetical protein